MLHFYEYDPLANRLTFFYENPLTQEDKDEAAEATALYLGPARPGGCLNIRWIHGDLAPQSRPVLTQEMLDLLPAFKAAARLLVLHSRTGPVPMHELVATVARMYHVPLSVASRTVVELVSEGSLRLNPDRTLDTPYGDTL